MPSFRTALAQELHHFFLPGLPCVPKLELLLFCSEDKCGFSKYYLTLTHLMPCLPFWPALDLNCPWEPLSNPHYHNRHSLQQRYCTLLPPWLHCPAEMVSLPTLCEVYCRPHLGAL